MPNTTILLRDQDGLRIPSLPSLTIAAGDEVTFTAEKNSDTAIYFSPATAAILTPSPAMPTELKSGHSVSFAFASTFPEGAYGVIVQAPTDHPPHSLNFGEPATPPVLVIQSGGLGTYVPTNTTGT
jgi:hypothetical protein